MITLTFEEKGKIFTEKYDQFGKAIDRIVKVYEKDRKAIGTPKYDGRLELRGMNADNLKEAGVLASFANRISNNDGTLNRKLTTKEIEKSIKITQDQVDNFDKVKDIDLINSETEPLWVKSYAKTFSTDGIIIEKNQKSDRIEPVDFNLRTDNGFSS